MYERDRRVRIVVGLYKLHREYKTAYKDMGYNSHKVAIIVGSRRKERKAFFGSLLYDTKLPKVKQAESTDKLCPDVRKNTCYFYKAVV